MSRKVKMNESQKGRRRRESVRTFFLLLPYALLFLAFIAIPVAIAVGLSFTYFDVINTPTFLGLDNYISLITQDEAFLKFVLPNTIQYALIVGPGGFCWCYLEKRVFGRSGRYYEPYIIGT